MPSTEALLAQILARLSEIRDIETANNAILVYVQSVLDDVYEVHEGGRGSHIHVYDTGRGPNIGAPHHDPNE